MPTLRPAEIILILLVVLLLFGAKRLPDLSRSVGRSLRIFKSETRALADEDKPERHTEPIPPRQISATVDEVTEVRPPVNEPDRTER
ncbi:MAG: Sec-independent protein translocase subunit TatA [Sporichthyaceae bacterium]|nr:Sec-independent protein translocase subunit TatA [Sporichthyaceae bacterium]